MTRGFKYPTGALSLVLRCIDFSKFVQGAPPGARTVSRRSSGDSHSVLGRFFSNFTRRRFAQFTRCCLGVAPVVSYFRCTPEDSLPNYLALPRYHRSPRSLDSPSEFLPLNERDTIDVTHNGHLTVAVIPTIDFFAPTSGLGCCGVDYYSAVPGSIRRGTDRFARLRTSRHLTRRGARLCSYHSLLARAQRARRSGR